MKTNRLESVYLVQNNKILNKIWQINTPINTLLMMRHPQSQGM